MKFLRFIFIISFFIAVFVSCTTDVDIYAEYRDVPIIYAMLDFRSDTNFVKITRAFCGTNDDHVNANEVAQIYDSCNYPGKLDARIIELESIYGGFYRPTGREFVLDTITIHDKEDGVFYSPDQLVYYTTERFKSGSNANRYKYRLILVKPMVWNELSSRPTARPPSMMSKCSSTTASNMDTKSQSGKMSADLSELNLSTSTKMLKARRICTIWNTP